MSTTPSPFDSNSERSPLKLDRPAEGNELVIETGDSEDEEEIILASNADGGSLTLLEEYSIKEKNNGKWATIITFGCAATSLVFAYMIFSTL